eukprot:CAMPEP_0204206662 /NCGR_PEP_ID=MMETSP0361-20130328/71209_1 /ASSEMBLY_ACC=CAM_ASM_000343 /TAXON_ID=268821 /ORGANISM="Scrippsiella Hangoei, Strain SHTV-5" /LENGTH=79 /DNA_ID=CAMNT_0051170117 /DNA_START=246 /DNA_END=481 /DNA_ORIENTATION=-
MAQCTTSASFLDRRLPIKHSPRSGRTALHEEHAPPPKARQLEAAEDTTVHEQMALMHQNVTHSWLDQTMSPNPKAVRQE